MKQLGLLIAAALIITPTVLTAVEPAGSNPEAPAKEIAQGTTVAEPTDLQNSIVLYYFHGARRCRTCLTIEANAEELLRSQFGKELDSGALVWKVVNYDEPENEHFINDYGLVSASLVVVEMKAGETVRFEILQKAWSLVRDKLGFNQYVHRSILDFMG